MSIGRQCTAGYSQSGRMVDKRTHRRPYSHGIPRWGILYFIRNYCSNSDPRRVLHTNLYGNDCPAQFDVHTNTLIQ